jgi:hypothetical protein
MIPWTFSIAVMEIVYLLLAILVLVWIFPKVLPAGHWLRYYAVLLMVTYTVLLVSLIFVPICLFTPRNTRNLM